MAADKFLLSPCHCRPLDLMESYSRWSNSDPGIPSAYPEDRLVSNIPRKDCQTSGPASESTRVCKTGPHKVITSSKHNSDRQCCSSARPLRVHMPGPYPQPPQPLSRKRRRQLIRNGLDQIGCPGRPSATRLVNMCGASRIPEVMDRSLIPLTG